MRIAAWRELRDGPCFVWHRGPTTDMHFFDRWAREVAAGDLASARVERPLHTWLSALAVSHLIHHPDRPESMAALAAGGGRPTSPEAQQAVWDFWLGGPTFFQEPLYPYLMAATYAALGDDPRWVFAWQCALGLASVVLVAHIARSLFGGVAGASAGLMMALHGPALMTDFLLLRESLILLLSLVLPWFWWRESIRPGPDGPRVWAAAAMGLGAGAAVLLKSTFAVPMAVLSAWTLIDTLLRHDRPTAVARLTRLLAPAAAGFAAAMIPLVVRNVSVGVSPLTTASTGGLVFAFCNTAGFDPDAGNAQLADDVAEAVSESRGRFLPAVRASIRTFEGRGGLAGWLGLLARKAAVVWHWYETPDNASLYYWRLHSATLRLAAADFGVVAPLALAGLVLAARRRFAGCLPAALMIAAFALSLVVFFCQSRYRLPLTAWLLPFAGLAVSRLWEAARSRRFVPVAAIVGVAAVGAAAMWRPLPEGRPLIRRFDYNVAHACFYGPRCRAAVEAGDRRAADAVLEEALSLEPRSPDPPSPEQQGIRDEFAAVRRLKESLGQ